MGILDKLQNLEPPDKLYHYTTLTGLKGIIEEKKLWTTKIRFLNDSSELIFTLNRMKVLLDNWKSNHPEDTYKVDSSIGDLNSIYRANIFLSSFSKDFDSLSQFRGYGNETGSFMIGFNGRKLKEIIENQGYHFIQCI